MKQRLKDYLIPHSGNNYAPHSLQKAALGIMTFLVLLTFATANLQSILWISSDWMVSTILPAVVVDQTNQQRSIQSLGTVVRNSTLDRAAQLKAQHMAENSYFSHYSPDGISPWYWFGQVGYSFVHAGENLAVHFTDSSEVVAAWMASPTHRANILNGDYQEIGIGTAKGVYEGFETVYVVQLFGTPSTAVSVKAPAPVVAGVESGSDNDSGTPQRNIESVPTTSDTATSIQSIVTSSPITAGQDVAITETVERIPDPTVTTSTLTAETADIVITTTSTTDTTDVYFSGFISTTTAATPAYTQPIDIGHTPMTFLARIGTQPQNVLQAVYTGLALVVVVTLLLAVFIEVRRQQPVQIVYTLLLLLLLSSLWYVHTSLTAGALIV